MERASMPKNVKVVDKSYGRSIGGIFVLLLVLVLVVIIFIIIRRKRSNSSQTGSGSSECISNFDCESGQACNTVTGTCVECVTNGDCTTEKSICDLNTNTCKRCLENADCPFDRPTCDTVADQCYECNNNSECGIDKPICSPSGRVCIECDNNSNCSGLTQFCNPQKTCVECLSNTDCAVGSCVNGSCCDLTPPNIASVTSSVTPNFIVDVRPMFTINYSFPQAPSLVSGAILSITNDHGDFVLSTSPFPATGSYTFTPLSSSSLPKLFFGYTYSFTIRLLTICGSTPESNVMTGFVDIPDPNPFILDAQITNIIYVDTSIFEVLIKNISPGSLTCGDDYKPQAYIGIVMNLEPNSTFEAPLTSLSVDCSPVCVDDSCLVTTQWPIAVVPGQTYYVKFSSGSGQSNVSTLTNEFPIIIPSF